MSPRPSEPGAWGPTIAGGRRLRGLRTTLVVLASVVALGAIALASTGFLLYQQARSNVTRVPLSELSDRDPTAAQHFLIVGSDSRDELSRERRTELGLGHDFGGSRSDAIILVSILPRRAGVSVVNFPRDLYVSDDGRPRKLNETFNEGPNNLVQVLRDNFGIPINHYVEVSVEGFIDVVETIGEVEICLDEPLVDRKANADFDAGCRDMTPPEALSYVRSRVGSDFRRMERQQTFMKAMLGEMTDAEILTDVPRLFRVVEEVARNVATDDGLELAQMRALAEELRVLADGDIPMTFVPGYTRDLDTPGVGTQNFVVAYEPGARALLEDLREGNTLPSRGSPEDRAATSVAIWSGGRADGLQIVHDTLGYAGFDNVYSAGPGDERTDAGTQTVVYELPGRTEAAGWVAATLGAEVEPLPPGVEAPQDTDVVIAVGQDATGGGGASR